MKIQDTQQAIFEQTGLKTSVKKNKGSMKNHITISTMFQSGEYPKFDFQWREEFKKQFKSNGQGVFCSGWSFDIPLMNFTDLTPIQYKKESKPKTIEDMKVKQWGSKNSQTRLDKAAARNAKKMKKGNTARYW